MLDQRRLATLFGRQRGVAHITQLRACGLSASVVAKRVRRGELFQIHPAVYALTPTLTREGSWFAAVLAGGPDALLGCEPAIQLLGGWRRDPVDEPTVFTPHLGRGRGLAFIHVSRTLEPRDATRCNGIPITAPPRTCLDLGDKLTEWHLANVLHELAVRQPLHRAGFCRVLERNRGRRRAAGRLTRALNLRDSGSAGTMSPREDLYVSTLLSIGGRKVIDRVNALVDPNDGGPPIRPDLSWWGRRLIVQIDGRNVHLRPATKAQDYIDDGRLRAAGWRVLRVPGRHAAAHAAELARGLLSVDK